jgi:hypothetical protein
MKIRIIKTCLALENIWLSGSPHIVSQELGEKLIELGIAIEDKAIEPKEWKWA